MMAIIELFFLCLQVCWWLSNVPRLVIRCMLDLAEYLFCQKPQTIFQVSGNNMSNLIKKRCFMFNKIGELLLLPLVLYYLKGLKNDKFGFANLSFNQFNSRNRDSTMFSLFIVSICPICISVLRQQDVTSAKIDSKSTSYMRSDGQHAPLYAQTLQTMYKTYPWHIGTCTYLLVQFVLSGTFIPTRYQTSAHRVVTTDYGDGG